MGSRWTESDNAQFRTWLRAFVTHKDRMALEQMARLMLVGDYVFSMAHRVWEYEDRREVVQETVAAALSPQKLQWVWDHYGDRVELGSYMKMILNNVLSDRTHDAFTLLETDPPEEAASLDEILTAKEEERMLQQLLKDVCHYVQDHAHRWPPQTGRWFMARYVDGLSDGAIARQDGVTREHVNRTLGKVFADGSFRDWLQEYFAKRLGETWNASCKRPMR